MISALILRYSTIGNTKLEIFRQFSLHSTTLANNFVLTFLKEGYPTVYSATLPIVWNRFVTNKWLVKL